MNRFVCDALAGSFRVHAALNGKEGFALARSLRPDLIICDFMMPEMSGDELVRAVRAEPRIDATPILILTARNDATARIDVLARGRQRLPAEALLPAGAAGPGRQPDQGQAGRAQPARAADGRRARPHRPRSARPRHSAGVRGGHAAERHAARRRRARRPTGCARWSPSSTASSATSAPPSSTCRPRARSAAGCEPACGTWSPTRPSGSASRPGCASPDRSTPPSTGTSAEQLLAVLRESLSNVIRHADATVGRGRGGRQARPGAAGGRRRRGRRPDQGGGFGLCATWPPAPPRSAEPSRSGPTRPAAPSWSGGCRWEARPPESDCRTVIATTRRRSSSWNRSS